MNSTLTRPQSIQELYKTYFAYANKFKFTDLTRNYIQSEEWKDTSQEPIWEIFSKIADDIGAILTDGIVNYTRNVVDINTCKVPMLIEHSKMLSYGLDHIKNSYGFFPSRIQCLVDIFSINPEYLIGNHQNHILSDQVIREILIYIRDNAPNKTTFQFGDMINKLLVDPHSLIDRDTYEKFVQALFYVTLAQALSAPYSTEDGQPMVFNMLWQERKNQKNVLSRIDEYKTWVDKFIWNEIEHPLNDKGLANTIWNTVENTKNQKQLSSKFNPFKVADHIYFNGLNPNNKLSQDELDLVEYVMDYHGNTKYDYETENFVDDVSTQFAYYKELEWCEYVKMTMFVMNNLNSFNIMDELTYDISSNKFLHTGAEDYKNCTRVAKIFKNGSNIVQADDGEVAIDTDILSKVSEFIRDFVFHIQEIRENVKTIAQKHAMRGTGALLVHMVNDYLIKELPRVRDMLCEGVEENIPMFQWELDNQFKNYGNATVLEYEDDNEYFNIEPVETVDVTFSDSTNERYWEKLNGMEYDDTLGVFTKRQIRDFYRDTLGMKILQPKKPNDYDDIQDFLVDLFKIGANPIKWNQDEDEFHNPIDDIIYDSEEMYGYSKQERMAVQRNQQLRKNQERQFKEYTGNQNIIGQSIYDLVNSKLFYWKNTEYSSHVLHPFMYNLKLWNKLNNIIINGYRDYIDNDLIDYLSSKIKFDELFGKFGEGRNFWKYNVMDLTGYTTRYEAAIKDEHIEESNATSPLTGYDGLFYPNAIQEFLDLMKKPTSSSRDVQEQDFSLTQSFFTHGMSGQELEEGKREFVAAIYSIYWQENETTMWKDGVASKPHKSFYNKWYSHLNCTRNEYQKMALQLWYWRDRIQELATNEYPIQKYCIDIQGNSLILVSTFTEGEKDTNQYLIDLALAHQKVERDVNQNKNTHVSFCETKIRMPSELWIRWKSSPIAIPALDVWYDKKVGDAWFDHYHRSSQNTDEMGQLTHTNNKCNENFKIVLLKWRDMYGSFLKERTNRLPVFFDMEQSANVLAIASWNVVKEQDDDEIVILGGDGEESKLISCGKNPLHILSIERIGTEKTDYNLEMYSTNGSINPTKQQQEWLFDEYHYCQADGSILIPLYAFDCSDDGEDEHQTAKVRMYLVPAQTLKDETYVAKTQISMLDGIVVDLNQTQDHQSGKKKYLFDHPIKVCRSTNMVFSPYDAGGVNKVRCAFLGQFSKDTDAYSETSMKFSSCDAKTRYEFDSQSTSDLALTKGSYFKENGTALKSSESGLLYIDKKVANEKFNSYDSLDKFAFVLDFMPSIDYDNMFKMSWKTNLLGHSYNILGDAGYIPHFAYQSLVKFGDKDGGTAYTWKNKYLNGKDHMQFELLGLDDSVVAETYKVMQKMVVKDITDDCDSLICPAKFMDNIYRIWCENKTKKRREAPWEDEDPYDSYFANEYIDYPNEEVDFNHPTSSDNGYLIVDWDVSKTVGLKDNEDKPVPIKDKSGNNVLFGFNENVGVVAFKVGSEYVDINGRTIENIDEYNTQPIDDGLFEIDLHQENLTDEEICNLLESDPEDKIEQFKELLDEYYVCVLRSENGQILNEKRYLLKPTPLSEFFLGMGDKDGFIKCNLSPWQSPMIENDHYVDTQVVFAGTPNPFSYDADGEKIYSRQEELQYGNGVCGLDSLELKIDIVTGISTQYLHNLQGNLALTSGNEPYFRELPFARSEYAKKIKPTLRFKKKIVAGTENLTQRVHGTTMTIPKGEVMVVISHKNMDNIAKYHIMNASSNLYFGGSLPKNGQQAFKYSDFKFDATVTLYLDKDNWWKSLETKEDGNPILQFENKFARSREDWEEENEYLKRINSLNRDCLPPYVVYVGNEEETWFLEQNELVPLGNKKQTFKKENPPVKYLDDCQEGENCHLQKVENPKPVEYDIPTKGNFIYAHRLRKEKPEKYLDYLYIKNGWLQFKVSEESQSFADAMTTIPPFHIDWQTRNKLDDLNDIQILDEHATFIHQSEQPDKVRDCGSFNPLVVEAVLKLGLEQKDGELGKNEQPKLICANTDVDNNVIQLDNLTNKTRLKLQLEKGEVDEFLKIYTTYEKVDDENGDYHYDLYFNVQNLFNSPFEYISSVTRQPNVLIIPDSYLYLPGEKYKRVGDHNEIDEVKVKDIHAGGELSLYGQVKTYSDGKLSDAKTIKLFTYRIFNVSDDKPKFLIQKTFDITKSSLSSNMESVVDIKFSDVMWTVQEDDFNEGKFKELNKDIIVVQPVHIHYNWDKNDDYRFNEISFDIRHDIIDFNNVPELCEWWLQARTLRDRTTDGNKKPYYDHWSDKYMTLEINPTTKVPRLTLKYDEERGFNFETIYLKWRLPKGFRMMDTMDRLGGIVFGATADNISTKCNNSSTIPKFNVTVGHVMTRVPEQKEMYLGLEHSTTKRMNGFVLVGLGQAIDNAIKESVMLTKAKIPL